MSENFDEPVASTPESEMDPWASNDTTTVDDFLLGDLGLDDVSANPNFVADGGYVATVAVKVSGSKKEPNRRYLVFTYTIKSAADGSPTEYASKTVQEWKSADKSDDAQQKSFLKQRIMSFGIPEEEVSRFSLGMVQGATVLVEIKNNGDYTNVNRVKPLGEGVSLGAATGSSGSIDF